MGRPAITCKMDKAAQGVSPIRWAISQIHTTTLLLARCTAKPVQRSIRICIRVSSLMIRAVFYDWSYSGEDTSAINFSSPLELDRYVYAANDPINFSDPSGHTLAESGILNFGAVRKAAVITAIAIGVIALYGAISEVLEDTETASQAFE